MSRPTIIVIAKAPAPNRSKTRLCPPCTPEEAAQIAEAALADTLDAVCRTGAARKVVALDGEPGPWLPPGFEVVDQRGGGLDERLAAAFEDTGGPALLIGMDTPQVTPELLEAAGDLLMRPDTDAVLGPASDGGWWAMGLRRPDPRTTVGVPMSTSDTGMAQRQRLAELGLRVRMLPALRDVDVFEDAIAVASGICGSRFHQAVSGVAERRTR